jgi:hypothetical protein
VARSHDPRLATLLELLDRKPNQRTWRFLGRALGALNGRATPYDTSYFSGLHTGSKPTASGPIALAMDRLIYYLRSGEEVFENAVVQTVDPPGVNGAMVLGPAIVCAEPGCGRHFIPNHPRRNKCYLHSPPSGHRVPMMTLFRLMNALEKEEPDEVHPEGEAT